MPRHIVASALATLFLAAAAIAAPTGKWVEVRSPNFIVVSNAGEAQARKTAVQFEQIRSLFRDSLSYVKSSPSPVITILAVKDEDSLRELLPEFWAEKGHTHPAGIFLSGGYDQFQVAVNLAAHGDNPYDDAEAIGRSLRASTTDDTVREQADEILDYVKKARDYDARMRQMQEEEAVRAAARANELASAARSDRAVARSDEPAAEKMAEPTGPTSDSNAPVVLKRRGGANEVIGVVIHVRCNGGEMEVTAKVADRAAPLLFRAKDHTRIGYASNVATIHNDIEPCSELKGHTAKLSFTPSEAKWLDGELVQIVIEK